MSKQKIGEVESRLLSRFSEYRNRHKNDTIIVCGCGHSLTQLSNPENFITIGVNDVGRQFDPDYLVVLNPRNQFKNDRFKYIENSRAKAIFTQLNLGINHPNIVRFKLGERGGTDCSNPSILPYTRNSPYVALCLAAAMGAKRIGLIGVDFTDHHFFMESGRHVLNKQIDTINKEYQKLKVELTKQDIEVVNLSAGSLLRSFPKQSIQDFEANRKVRVKGSCAEDKVNMGRQIKVQIERYRGPLSEIFLNQLAKTIQEMGYPTERRISPYSASKKTLAIVWNGRRHARHNNLIYCEHGWLPRDAYQVSTRGINADSHIAPFTWNGGALSDHEKGAVDKHMAALKAQKEFGQIYTSTTEPVVTDLPPAFLLVPLQIESDTNIIRHVAPSLRKMQAVVDFVSQSNPPYPIIFKQHPSDQRRNQHLRLQIRRKCDFLRSHDKGNIHQILKSGRCKGIISLNSNVVHDGFLWGVPSIVLGRNIWPRAQPSPFLLELPKHWETLEEFHSQESTKNCIDSYIHYLLKHQWTLEDASNKEKVAELLDRKFHEFSNGKNIITLAGAGRRRKLAPDQIRVNVFALNRGWLFEDIKQQFAALSLPGIKIIASERPRTNADVWICLRASEAIKSPDKSRTLVQIHDQFDSELYVKGAARGSVSRCGAICFTNAQQKIILAEGGIDLTHKKTMLRSLGALANFTPRTRLEPRFTIAWVGRPVIHNGEEFKRASWLVDALSKLGGKDQISVTLIGEKLGQIKADIAGMDIDTCYLHRRKLPHHLYPNEYRKFDCLVITSKFAAGPNCLFEALASGVPVVSTACGWAEELIEPGVNGYIVESPEQIAKAIDEIRQRRSLWFSRRHEIHASNRSQSLESWLEQNIRLAASLMLVEKTALVNRHQEAL